MNASSSGKVKFMHIIHVTIVRKEKKPEQGFLGHQQVGLPDGRGVVEGGDKKYSNIKTIRKANTNGNTEGSVRKHNVQPGKPFCASNSSLMRRR